MFTDPSPRLAEMSRQFSCVYCSREYTLICACWRVELPSSNAGGRREGSSSGGSLHVAANERTSPATTPASRWARLPAPGYRLSTGWKCAAVDLDVHPAHPGAPTAPKNESGRAEDRLRGTRLTASLTVLVGFRRCSCLRMTARSLSIMTRPLSGRTDCTRARRTAIALYVGRASIQTTRVRYNR